MVKRKILTLFAAAAAEFLMMGCVPTAAVPVKMPDGQMFDAEYYAANNSDVVKVYGTDANALYGHYMAYGRLEKRLPYIETSGLPPVEPRTACVMPDGGRFDFCYYAANNPDAVQTVGPDKDALYCHFMLYGRWEGRLPYAGALPCGTDVDAKTGPVRYEWTATPADTHESIVAKIRQGYMVYDTRPGVQNYWEADIVTTYGKQIYSLHQGDVVMIDGIKILIDGEFIDSYLRGTISDSRAGIAKRGADYNSMAFQTCVPNGHGKIVIKYGHPIH